jgi:exopolyphosphatase/guanosine-5'-triphosphate,3'-diphosphate pyrophosphatase
LHDIQWRAHPDYRAELSLESVTRANIAGLDHAERVFLGLALLNRYKPAVPPEDIARYAALLSAERTQEAAVLGRAMRLGAMLSGACTGVLEHAALARSGARLVLTLRGPARAYAGEAVEKRLQSLAQRLGCAAEIVVEE